MRFLDDDIFVKIVKRYYSWKLLVKEIELDLY